MAESTAFVLESFALLAYLQDEPIAPRVEKLLENADWLLVENQLLTCSDFVLIHP